MAFIDDIINKATCNAKTIVLPEGTDIRVLQAASILSQQHIAKIIILGNKDEINLTAQNNNINLTGVQINDISTSDNKDKYIQTFYELRKHKGILLEDAQKAMQNPIYWGTMMVKSEDADGMVAGALNSTADVMRPALQIIKPVLYTDVVTTLFIVEVPNCNYGYNGMFVFADCALIENPDEKQLASIAIASAKSFEQLIGTEAIVAMLSYSTYGSAQSEVTQKVVNATKLVKQIAPHIIIDGELQADAALVEQVGKTKAPGSVVAGRANVLVFPDLNSGNISYKLVQRLANARAFGPITQGLAKPVNDLSRGCSVADIVGVVALTSVQAQYAN